MSVIARGTIGDWALVTRAIRRDPWGSVARQVELYLSYSSPYGVGPLLAHAIGCAREDAEAAERAAVAAEIRGLVASSGLTSEEFALRIGTSRSRLSTYRNGRVTPSAAMLVRMLRVADARGQPGS